MHIKITKKKLDKLYNMYHRREYVHPDPLEFLYAYDDLHDREIAGLIASSLAYGRVAQILKSVSYVLDIMGQSPVSFIKKATRQSLKKDFSGFAHRFATGDKLSQMLVGAKEVIKQYGSLYECFISGLNSNDETILSALTLFVDKITENGNNNPGHLLPLPKLGSACKRLNLFLRWMVRRDDVDPGGWEDVPLSKLIIPLDTHMHKIGILTGLTSRTQPNMRTALEITDGFRKLVPEDPVKYDFSLTRIGIRGDANYKEILCE